MYLEHHSQIGADVGIAEQHAVTFAAGLACEGYKPFAAIYSTFLQRAYDQVVHDVAVKNLPVRFAIDRAGLVGADGATHQGAFDLSYLCCLQNMTVMAPADEVELTHAVATAAAHNSGPFAFRYPRGEGVGLSLPENSMVLPIGKGRILRQGQDIAVLALGPLAHTCLNAADTLAAQGVSPTIADARFAKPLDLDLLHLLAQNHRALLVVEEAAFGGFAAWVLRALCTEGYLDGSLKCRSISFPDLFIDHDSPRATASESWVK